MQLRQAQEARSAGVAEKALIDLARRYGSEASTVEQARADLIPAIEVATRVQEEGRHSSNLRTFLDEVLNRTAALSASGDYDAVTMDLNSAIEDIDAAGRVVKSRLLDRHIANDRLRRDFRAAARHVKERAENNDPQMIFSSLDAEFLTWVKLGRERGSNFDLEVGVHLGEHAAQLAPTPIVFGKILISVGMTHDILAWRTADPVRYRQAIVLFSEAMEFLPYCVMQEEWLRAASQRASTTVSLATSQESLGLLLSAIDELKYLCSLSVTYQEVWAATNNNLGNALVEAGVLAQTSTVPIDTDNMFRLAIEAYQASLAARSLNGSSGDWRMLQNNLGRAYSELGEYEAAVAAHRRALSVRHRGREPARWAMSKHNLANSLMGLAYQINGRSLLEEARRSISEALQERTEELVPIEWAMSKSIQGNIDLVEYRLGGERVLLDRAEEYLRAAMSRHQELASTRHVRQCQGLLDTISLLRQR